MNPNCSAPRLIPFPKNASVPFSSWHSPQKSSPGHLNSTRLSARLNLGNISCIREFSVFRPNDQAEIPIPEGRGFRLGPSLSSPGRPYFYLNYKVLVYWKQCTIALSNYRQLSKQTPQKEPDRLPFSFSHSPVNLLHTCDVALWAWRWMVRRRFQRDQTSVGQEDEPSKHAFTSSPH